MYVFKIVGKDPLRKSPRVLITITFKLKCKGFSRNPIVNVIFREKRLCKKNG